MKIVEKSKARAIIVIPTNPTKREIYAANELQFYIKQMSGAILDIIDDSTVNNLNEILIGGPERNKKVAFSITEEDFDIQVPGPEGIMIKTFDEKKLVLAGSSKKPNEFERGTVYAIYEFLERFLGVSLAAYSNPSIEAGEYIPNNDEIVIKNICYIKENLMFNIEQQLYSIAT